MTTGTGVCAAVVTYFPDTGLKTRLDALLPQVDFLTVVDNTPAGANEQRLEDLLPKDERICVLQNGVNLGVAAALNQGLAQALEKDCGWLLTLDQDSFCYPDMVKTLLRVRDSCKPIPVVIGGNYVDTRNKRAKVSVGSEDEFLEQKTVITSGCLVNVSFAKIIKGFREDYFIDQLDHEFCLRARQQGGRIVISRKPVMEHCVGEAGGVWVPFLGYLPNHAPLRKYYVARNSLVTIAKYWRSEPDWCLRRLIRLFMGLVGMIILEKHGFAKARAFFAGVADYCRGNMGRCPHSRLGGGT